MRRVKFNLKPNEDKTFTAKVLSQSGSIEQEDQITGVQLKKYMESNIPSDELAFIRKCVSAFKCTAITIPRKD